MRGRSPLEIAVLLLVADYEPSYGGEKIDGYFSGKGGHGVVMRL
jgi:hypothetical protein